MSSPLSFYIQWAISVERYAGHQYKDSLILSSKYNRGRKETELVIIFFALLGCSGKIPQALTQSTCLLGYLALGPALVKTHAGAKLSSLGLLTAK